MRARLLEVAHRVTRGGLRRAAPVLALVAVVVFLRATAPGPAADASPPPTAPTPTAVVSRQPYAPAYGPTPTATATTPAAARPEARLATQFVAAWLDTSGGRQAWLARLAPLCAQDLADGLAVTDPATIPHGAVTGVRDVTGTRLGDALVVVATTGGDVRVYVARRDATTWQVNSIEPA